MGHQKAAYEILSQLYTPQSAAQTPIGRAIFEWYSRLDIFVAMMGGFPVSLPGEWFTTAVEFCETQIIAIEDNLRWKIEDCSMRLRLLAKEMANLLSKQGRGEITDELFTAEHEELLKRLQDWKTSWDPVLTDQTYVVTDFSHQRPLGADDIVNPYVPGILFDNPIFAMTMLTTEWHAAVLMHLCQSPATAPRNELYAQLRSHAYSICQICEALERWPNSPKGSLILNNACMAIASLFLPQDGRHQMWARRKFALLETMG
jgi:hypothetical protein